MTERHSLKEEECYRQIQSSPFRQLLNRITYFYFHVTFTNYNLLFEIACILYNYLNSRTLLLQNT